jgi:hypothetical protein
MVTTAPEARCNWRTLSVRTTKGHFLTVTVPTRNDIANLKVGDFAPSGFTDPRRVVETTARRDDIHGKLFVCYYTEFGENARMSGSAKEDEMDFSVCWKVDSLHSEMEHMRGQVERKLAEAAIPVGRGMHDCPECGKTVMHGSFSRLCEECADRMEQEEDDALPNIRKERS